MRRVLRKFAAEGVVEHIRLRDNDFWHGFAGDLNAALARATRQDQVASGESHEQSPLAEQAGELSAR
jgi:hypothetical protein